MNSIKIIYLHGNGTTDWRFAWATWVKNELEKLGLETVFETFPDSELARKQFWLPHLKDVLKADENTLLIGWSSGAVAAMRFAETHKIFGSLLIAPCHTDLGIESEKISGWYDEPWQWDKIKANQKQIGLFYSQYDEFIPQSEFAFIKENLQPDFVYEFPSSGHFIRQDTFPEVVECVRKMIGNIN